MTVDMCDQKGWNVRASDLANNTNNPIRAIVENLQLEPNPSKQMIAFSIGDPTIFGNLSPPKEVLEAVRKSLESGKNNGYAPSCGFLEARKAVAEYSSCSKVQVDATDVILCSGCSSALDLCISAIANPGENILVPRPGFAIYKTLAEGLGIRVKFYNLQPETGWEVDLNQLENQIDENTRAIVVNNPSNPCGSVFSQQHLLDILQVASRNRIPIIADEIYEHLVFPGEEFHSLASLSKDVPILSCSGLTKRFLIPGWRMGWIIIHDRNGVLNKLKKGLVSLSQRIMGSNTLVQGALPEILKNTPPEFYNSTIKTLHRNAMMAYKRLSDIPGLNPIMPRGAMYIMVGIDLAGFPDIKDEIHFVEQLVIEESVFCLPGKCFDYPNYMRLVLTVPEEMMLEAFDRILKFCERHYELTPRKSSGNILFLGNVSAHNSPVCDNSGRKP